MPRSTRHLSGNGAWSPRETAISASARSSWSHLWLGSALALSLALNAVSCSPSGEPKDLDTRAVVIGLDGADWKIIDQLIAEGSMPHLARLKQAGVWGPIETLHEMPLSPVIWTSVATGKLASKHGISWFMVDQPDGTRVPVRSTNRQTKAIWNILAEHRRRPVVVGWWATYPAEDVGRGVVVSDALGYHGFGASVVEGDDRWKTHPSSLFQALDPLVPPVQQINASYAQRFIALNEEEYGQLMYTPARAKELDPFNPIHLFQSYAATAEGYAAIAQQLLESRESDLFMVYFEQLDSLSHLFMKYAPPALDWVDRGLQQTFQDVVVEWYRYQDELLGELLTRIDLSSTAVFVLSDHGFKSGDRRIRSPNTVDVRKAHLDHESKGIFVAAGPHIRTGGRVGDASVLDMTPTLLHYLGFPVGKDMDGKVLDSLFEADFVKRNPIRYVSSWEEPEAPASKAQQTAAGGPTAEHDQEVERALDGLRALGYLSNDRDRPAADPQAGSPELSTNRGRIHLVRGDLEQARQELETALELDPSHADALLVLSEVERAAGRIAEAEHLVRRALQVDPGSVGALAQLAGLERDRGRLDEALRLFEQALAIDDSSPDVFVGYGDILQRAGRLDDADRAFRDALALNPDSYKAYYNLGVTAANRGQLELAIGHYLKALEVAPEHPERANALNNLGAIHQARGEIAEAAGRFEESVSASSHHLEARYNLGMIRLGQGRLEEAVALLEAAAALQPNHEQVSVQLGMAELQLGRLDEAARRFQLVRRLYPTNWPALLGLARLHAGAGQDEQARSALGEALRIGGDEAKAEAERVPALQSLRR